MAEFDKKALDLQLVDDARGLEPGSPELERQVKAIVALRQEEMDEMKFENDAFVKNNEQKLKERENRTSLLKIGTDIGKTILLAGVYVWGICKITKHEETDAIYTKSHQLAPKLPLFK